MKLIALVVLSLLFWRLSVPCYSQEQRANVIDAIIAAAQRRDNTLRRVDATFSWEWFKKGSESPYMKISGRWAKDGDNLFTNVEETSFLAAGKEISTRQIVAYDGKVAKSYHPNAMRGMTFANIDDHTKRMGGFFPDNMSTVFYQQRLTDMLQSKPVTLLKGASSTVVERAVRLVGEESVGGHSCVVVESQPVVEGRPVGELCRLYFCEQLGYAPVRMEYLMSTAEGALGVIAKWTMEDFKELTSGAGAYWPSRALFEGGDGFARVEAELKFPETTDPALFIFKYPTGTRVYDATMDVWYTAGGGMMPQTVPQVDVRKPDLSHEGLPTASESLIKPSSAVGSNVSSDEIPQPEGKVARKVKVLVWAVIGVMVLGAILLLALLRRRRG